MTPAQKKAAEIAKIERTGTAEKFDERMDMKQPIGVDYSVPTSQPEVTETPESKPFDWSRLLIGATPALVGVLTGAKQAGFETAGQGLLNYEQQQLQAMQEAMKARQKAETQTKGRRFQVVPVESGGKIVNKVFDTYTGEMGEEGDLRGFRRTVRADPRTQELVQVGGATGEIAPVVDRTAQAGKADKFNVRQSNEIEKGVRAMLTSDSYKKAKSSRDAAQSALAILSSKNPIGDATSGTLILRMLGEVGAFTDREKAQAGGSRALDAKLEQMFETAKTGRFTDENRADLLEIAKLLDNMAKNRIKSTAGNYIQSLKVREGFDPTEAFTPYIEGMGDYYKQELERTKAEPFEGAIIERYIPEEKRTIKLKKTKKGWEPIDE